MASFYHNYYRYYRPYSPMLPKNSSFVEKKPSDETSSQNHILATNSKESSKNDTETPIFEILGIQLFLDDLIILSLLFFLYQEGVQDELLFIALIFLLLS